MLATKGTLQRANCPDFRDLEVWYNRDEDEEEWRSGTSKLKKMEKGTQN